MPSRRLKPLLIAGMVSIAGIAAGCGIGGIDGVELQGGVFDMLGVSGNSQRRVEPKVAARPGIVLPPVADRLPEPAAQPAAVTQEWPDDEDGRRVRAASDLDRQQAEFCEQARIKSRSRSGEAEPAEGPKGPCTQSIFGTFTNSNSQ